MSMLLLSRECHLGTSTIVRIEVDAPSQFGASEWNCTVRYRDGSGRLLGEQTIIGFDALQCLFNLSDGIRHWLNTNGMNVEWNGLPADLAFPRTLPASIGVDDYRELERMVDDFLRNKFS